MGILWLSLCVNDVWSPYKDFRALAASEGYKLECIDTGNADDWKTPDIDAIADADSYILSFFDLFAGIDPVQRAFGLVEQDYLEIVASHVSQGTRLLAIPHGPNYLLQLNGLLEGFGITFTNYEILSFDPGQGGGEHAHSENPVRAHPPDDARPPHTAHLVQEADTVYFSLPHLIHCSGSAEPFLLPEHRTVGSHSYVPTEPIRILDLGEKPVVAASWRQSSDSAPSVLAFSGPCFVDHMLNRNRPLALNILVVAWGVGMGIPAKRSRLQALPSNRSSPVRARQQCSTAGIRREMD